MYEYDLHHLIDPALFTPHPRPVPDAPPRPDDTREQWDLNAEFQQLFRPPDPQEGAEAEPAPAYPAEAGPGVRHAPPPRTDRRRKRPRVVRWRWAAVLGVVIAAITAVVTSTVSVLGAMVSYGPLRQLAFPTAHGLASAWPLLVYGPWFAGCLSVLHAAAHRRPAKAAWIAVVLFSAIAMALCIGHVQRSATAIATAGLPPVSALVSFHLLFRQITLLHPRHAKVPHQRRRKH